MWNISILLQFAHKPIDMKRCVLTKLLPYEKNNTRNTNFQIKFLYIFIPYLEIIK